MERDCVDGAAGKYSDEEDDRAEPRENTTTMEGHEDDERKDKDLTARYCSWEQTKVQNYEKTTAVENRGSEPWQDGPGTRAGGSFDISVAEMVE